MIAAKGDTIGHMLALDDVKRGRFVRMQCACGRVVLKSYNAIGDALRGTTKNQLKCKRCSRTQVHHKGITWAFGK